MNYIKNSVRFFLILGAISLFQILPSHVSSVQAQMGLEDPDRIALFNDIAANLACLCGCGATIKGCPHRKCGFAVPLKKDLVKMLKEDIPKEEIIAFFVKKHGIKLLAAPPKTGWYLIAYWLPVTLIVIVGFLIKIILSKWVSASATSRSDYEKEGVLSEEDAAYAEKLKKEMEDFDS